MSTVIGSSDLDEPSETGKVENVEESSSVSRDTRSGTNEEAVCIEDPSAISSAFEDHGVIQQDEVRTVDQHSTDVVGHDLYQNGDKNVFNAASSVQEENSDDCELKRNRDQATQDREIQVDEVAQDNIQQEENEGDNDSKPKSCEGESNDRENERDTPMESEDSYSNQMYDFSNDFCLIIKMLLQCNNDEA